MPAGDQTSVERRLERVENAVTELERKAETLEAGQGHLRELVNVRFSGIEDGMKAQAGRIEAVGSKLDGLIVTLQTMIQDNARLASEVSATPAGRVVANEIVELRQGRDENRRAIRSLEQRIWMASGAVSAVVFVVNLLAPLIRSALGIPT